MHKSRPEERCSFATTRFGNTDYVSTTKRSRNSLLKMLNLRKFVNNLIYLTLLEPEWELVAQIPTCEWLSKVVHQNRNEQSYKLALAAKVQ